MLFDIRKLNPKKLTKKVSILLNWIYVLESYQDLNFSMRILTKWLLFKSKYFYQELDRCK